MAHHDLLQLRNYNFIVEHKHGSSMNEHGRSTTQVRILNEVEAYDANFTNKFTLEVSHLYSEAACSHGQC